MPLSRSAWVAVAAAMASRSIAGSWRVSASVKSRYSPSAACDSWWQAQFLPSQPAGSGWPWMTRSRASCGGEARQNLAGAVGRFVVEDDHFEVGIVLIQQAARAGFDVAGFVARWN